MPKQLTVSDVYDINPKTGALIIGSNRLDDFVARFLKKYCAEALIEPMPLPVEKMIEAAGLTIETASLSKDLDVFGCCLLLDGYVDIFNPEKNEYVPTFYPAGTLLFDPNSEWVYGEGCKRNTLIHEMVHWDKDLTYFKILDRKNRKAKDLLYPIMCRQSRTMFEPTSGKRTKQNEVQWLEWQAHKLTPRILMPTGPFRQKALELLDADIVSCDELIQQLAEFFIVSRLSVKIRLLEVGLGEQLANFPDYPDVYAELNTSRDYVQITIEDSFELLQNNAIFEDWIESRGFVFVDGYFVLPDKKYITQKDGEYHLTKYATQNLSQCVINIQEQRLVTYKYLKEDLCNSAVLYKTGPEEIDQRILAFSPRMQGLLQEGIDKKEVASTYLAAKDNLIPYDLETEKELLRKVGDEDSSLCNCLWFLIDRHGCHEPLDFYDLTHVHENYFGRIRDNKANNMKSDTLMAICVGLGLRLRLTEKLYGKSECKLHYYEEPDMTWIRIMETYPGISIVDFNKLLKAAECEPLGTKDRTQKT